MGDYRWSIGMYSGDTPIGLAPGANQPALTPGPGHRLVADPFLAHHDGRWYCFHESAAEGSDVGAIHVAESDDGRSWAASGAVLAEPFHLSYPHTFRWRGEWFMSPETFGAGASRLYRARRFPDEWEHVADLVRERMSDPTPFHHEGRWWMLAGGRIAESELRLFLADDLRGPWREHPKSPVIGCDPTAARMAGRVIRWNGGLVRFGQDSGVSYGRSVRAFRIWRLTPEDYRESPMGTVLGPGAGWNAHGMHHIDAHELPDGRWIAAVDGW